MILIILIQSLFTLFVSGGLFFKEKLLKNQTIGLYFALFSIEIFYFLYGTSKVPTLYPQFHGKFYFSFGLIYGPLLWFHFKSIINPKTKLSLKDLISNIWSEISPGTSQSWNMSLITQCDINTGHDSRSLILMHLWAFCYFGGVIGTVAFTINKCINKLLNGDVASAYNVLFNELLCLQK